MKILIQLELDETYNEDIDIKEIVERAITLSDGVKVKIIYSSAKNDKEYDMIEHIVCGYTGIDTEEIQHKTRKREVVESRQICHYIAKQKGLGSLASIGLRFGRKDHATVLHSNRTVINLLETDKQFKNQYQSFIDSFFSNGS